MELRRGYSVPAFCAVIIMTGTVLQLAAYAHARLTKSEPADRAELTKSPSQIQVWFNELLEDNFNSIALFPAEQLRATSRTNLLQGPPTLDSKDRTHLTAKLKPLPPGEYTVEWRVLSRDGHSAPGRFAFKVLAPK